MTTTTLLIYVQDAYKAARAARENWSDATFAAYDAALEAGRDDLAEALSDVDVEDPKAAAATLFTIEESLATSGE